jgi:hypothetical protein
MEIDAVAAEIDAELRRLGTSDRAEKEKAYLKSDLRHYGTTMPAIHRVVKEVCTRYVLQHDDVLALVESLWAVPVHERRAASSDVYRGSAGWCRLKPLRLAYSASSSWRWALSGSTMPASCVVPGVA